jgi:quercetin dioxygenase-like cupin family protein
MNSEDSKSLFIDLEKLAKQGTVDQYHDWGYQIRLVNEPEYCGKLLVLENELPGSYHFHRKKKETFIVLEGKVELDVEDEQSLMILHAGDKYTIEHGVAHQMSAVNVPSIILEVSTHDDDSDTHRIKDNVQE